MATRFRQVLQVSVVALALGAGGFAAAAGVTGQVIERAREQQQQQQRSQPQRESRAEPRQQQRAEPRQQPPRNEPRVATPRAQPRDNAAPAQPRNERPRNDRERNERPRDAQPAARAPSAPVTGPVRPDSNNGNARSGERNDRGVVGGLIQREYQTRDPRPDRPANRPNRNDDRSWDRDRDNRDAWRGYERDRRRWEREHRHVHVVTRLPSGYRDYVWNGTRYYYHSGLWYRPSGSTFVTVGVPYGLFVTSLPGPFTSIWLGDTRYYYSDYHYYTYEPARRGYVVVRSPYEEEALDERLDEDLYIYPAQGQSEQQQADDRYGCHRWAVDETDYDPIDDEYDANLRQDYLRAMTACLTGRGYTVR